MARDLELQHASVLRVAPVQYRERNLLLFALMRESVLICMPAVPLARSDFGTQRRGCLHACCFSSPNYTQLPHAIIVEVVDHSRSYPQLDVSAVCVRSPPAPRLRGPQTVVLPATL